MNYMAGESNYDTERLQDPLKAVISADAGPNVMIIGAPVAHAGLEAVQYCPSVAAVVGSTAGNPTQYPGSSRLQPHLKKLRTKRGKEYVVDNAQIVDLKDMMEERFEAWQSIATAIQSQDPPAVIFYRDGLVYNSPATQGDKVVVGNKAEDTDIITQEMDAIKAANRTVFKVDLKQLFYVLISKNPRKPIATPAVTTEPRTYFTTEKDDASARYMYRVFDSDGDTQLDAQKFGELVSTLLFRIQYSETVY
jgi:hypothetical protein